jgi:hypothetical protein
MPLRDRLPPFRRHFHEAAPPAGRVSAAGLRLRRITPLDVKPAEAGRIIPLHLVIGAEAGAAVLAPAGLTFSIQDRLFC